MTFGGFRPKPPMWAQDQNRINGYAYVSSVWEWNDGDITVTTDQLVVHDEHEPSAMTPFEEVGQWKIKFRIICDGQIVSLHDTKEEAEALVKLVNDQKAIERGDRRYGK